MLKTCVKAVGSHGKSTQLGSEIYTQRSLALPYQWTTSPLSPLSIHNFCIQLCTPKLYEYTEARSDFSSLSTGLIINTIRENKENILVGNGG